MIHIDNNQTHDKYVVKKAWKLVRWSRGDKKYGMQVYAMLKRMEWAGHSKPIMLAMFIMLSHVQIGNSSFRWEDVIWDAGSVKKDFVTFLLSSDAISSAFVSYSASCSGQAEVWYRGFLGDSMQAKPAVTPRASAAGRCCGEEPEQVVLGLSFSYNFL